jgi:4-amino-4-deoxy-L-arabinose transferase-like glycosyltransferase
MLPRLKLPLDPGALALMAVAFILPGLTTHDPWKTQDVVGLGIVHGMAASGELLVPRVAGAPWMYDPPLYHWIAAAFGKLFGLVIEFHAGARLASGALVFAALYLVYRAARESTEDPAARRTLASAAALLVMGAVGLMVHAHEAVPELAALAALAGAFAALPYAAPRPLVAGTAFGAALGLAALSASWIPPAALALAALAAHFACPSWRSAAVRRFLAVALLVALPLAASWPLALALRAPHEFAEWHHLAFAPTDGKLAALRYFLSTGSWFAWPAWPLALWAGWTLRRRWNEPALFVPAASVLIALGALTLWGQKEDVELIPLLAPLALVAAHAVFGLRRGAAGALDWFGVLTFAVFTGLLWLGYSALVLGVPAPVARNLGRMAPGFEAHFSLAPVVVAVALACAWLYLIFFTPHAPLRSVARWAAGIILLWGTFAMLFMPWADYQKTYRSVALQLRSHIPVRGGCVAQRSLGVSQAAALDYHAGIRTQPFDATKPNACRLLLVQGSPEHEFDGPGAGWTKLADVGRPGDRGERYRLYRRNR